MVNEGGIYGVEAAVQDTISRRWPGVSEQVRFVVSNAEEFGHLSSAVAFAVAERVRGVPEQIARQIIQDCPVRGGTLSEGRGFLNVVLSESPELGSEAWRRKPDHSPLRIAVAPPCGVLRDWGYLRMVAAGLFQARLGVACAPEVTFRSAHGALEADELRQLPLESLRRVFAQCKGVSRTEYAQWVEREVAGIKPGERLVIWVYPPELPAGALTALRASVPASVTLCLSQRTWLEGVSYERSREEVLTGERGELLALMTLLAEPTVALDLDLEIARLDEFANFRFFVGACVARVEALQRQVDGASQVRPGADHPATTELAVALSLLPLATDDAAQLGNVRELLALARTALRRITRMLNAPEFRARCLRGELTILERKILAGVVPAFSDIMRVSGLI